jgi:general secretion pathway protein B
MPDAHAAPTPAAAPMPAPAPVVASGEGAPKPSVQPSVVASGEGAGKPAAGARAEAASKPATAAPPMPLYYELPYNVRKDLPALNVSMHVYAAVPAQRFVVVDGDRKAEGETIKDDVKLREIRPDGIVLEFRGQTFFYPRPGR